MPSKVIRNIRIPSTEGIIERYDKTIALHPMWGRDSWNSRAGLVSQLTLSSEFYEYKTHAQLKINIPFACSVYNQMYEYMSMW